MRNLLIRYLGVLGLIIFAWAVFGDLSRSEARDLTDVLAQGFPRTV